MGTRGFGVLGNYLMQTRKNYATDYAQYNQMIDHIRKNKRIQLAEEFEEGAKISRKELPGLKRELDMALQQLTTLQKSLILLKDYEGYSYEEIGKITGLNDSQVKVYLHRARLQIKTFIH